MLKSLGIRVTRKCNSRCLICHLWKERLSGREIKDFEYKKLFSRPEFQGVEEIFISGGEAFLRKDLAKITETILRAMPNISKFLLTTNGTSPKKAVRLFRKLDKNRQIKILRLAVSLEGDRAATKKIRGIDSYNSAISTIKLCRAAAPRLQTVILMTLTRLNCSRRSLNHIKKISGRRKKDPARRSILPA